MFFLPFAGDTPSGQQPNLVSLHVSLTLHPSSNGPVAAVLLSAQQPNSLLRHAAGFERRLHLSGFCSFVTIASRVFGVVLELHKSSSSVVDEMSVDELDQMSIVDDSVEISDVDSVLSVEPLSLVLLDSLDDSVVLDSLELDWLEDSLVLEDSLDDSLVLDESLVLDGSLVLENSLDNSLVLEGSLDDSLVLEDSLDDSVDASELLELDASVVLLPSVDDELELESVDDSVVESGCSVVVISPSVVESVVPAEVDSVL